MVQYNKQVGRILKLQYLFLSFNLYFKTKSPPLPYICIENNKSIQQNIKIPIKLKFSHNIRILYKFIFDFISQDFFYFSNIFLKTAGNQLLCCY